MEIWEIDRGNFRQVRLDHAINQQDIAKRAHVSKSTVCHYESRNTGKLEDHVEVKSDTEKMILRALVDLINEGFKSIDVRGGKLMGSVAKTGMSTCPRSKSGNGIVPKKEFVLSGEDDEHLIFIDNIKKYLIANDIRTKEFCELIGANKRIFEIGFNRGKPVSEGLKKKIFDATGWKYEDILSGAINKEGNEMYIPAKKTIDSEDPDVRAEAIQEYSPTAQELIDDKLDREECAKKAMAIIHKDKPVKPYVTKTIDDQAEKLTDMIVNGSSKEDISKAVEESKEAIKKSKTVGEVFDSLPEKEKHKVYIELGKAVKEAEKDVDPENLTGYEYAKAIGARLQMDTPNLYSGGQPVVPEGYSVMNKKYTYYAETGEYVLTYDLVKRFSRRISKEEFIASIKEDGK